MNTKLKLAIQNNNDLYKAVFDAQHIPSSIDEDKWYCVQKVPPYYSNIVTRSENWKPDSIFEQIDSASLSENWDSWSIKDSFQTLDLSSHGFNKLFDAEWMYLTAANFMALESEPKVIYKILENIEELSEWRLAWDSNKEIGEQIFYEEMLGNSNVKFLAGYKDNQLITGCLINKTESIYGISNFFAPDESVEWWSMIVSYLYTSLGKIDLVGYERSALLKQLANLGFENIGNLTVWLKNRP